MLLAKYSQIFYVQHRFPKIWFLFFNFQVCVVEAAAGSSASMAHVQFDSIILFFWHFRVNA